MTVNGALNYSGVSSHYLLVGGIIGEVQDGASGINLAINKCVSSLAITVQAGASTGSEASPLAVGGLIGKLASTGSANTVSINNCYTTGSITIQSSSGGSFASAGGLVGILGQNGAGSLTGVTINNCYSTTSIEIHNSASSMSQQRSAGGLIGKIRQVGSGAGALTVNNCIALNPKTISGDNASANVYVNRVIGFNERTNVLPTLNTYALKGMLVGTTADGTSDSSDGAATGTAGEGKTAGTGTGELRNSATWTAGLGFSTDVWDFSPLSSGGWPVLR